MKLLKVLLGVAAVGFAQTNCHDAEGIYAMSAALAVSLANETGRLTPLTDLSIQNDRLVLSTQGQVRCGQRMGCPNTLAILSMQEDAVSQNIPSSVFNPTIFRQRLVIQYQRQQIAAMRPATDPNRSWIPNHEITKTHTSTLLGCGVHYWFDVENLDSTTAVTPANLCSQLIYAGSQGTFNNGVCVSDNPFLDIRYETVNGVLSIGIDPLEGLEF